MHFKLMRMLGPFALVPFLAQGQQQTVTTAGGTVNVVPKYSGTATLVNSAIFEKSGKVGIGTTAPSATLTVNGGLTASGPTIVVNAFRFYTGSLDGNKSYVDFRANPTSGNSVISAKSGTLYLNLDHGTGGVSFGNGAAGVTASISAAGNAVFSGTGNSSFAGNLGIGTTTPSSKLTVAGLIQSTTGGFKFPDGSVLTTAAAKGIPSVSHDATLTGAGTTVSPLGLVIPLTLNTALDASALTLGSSAIGGHGMTATGGPNASGIVVNGGPGSSTYDGGDGIDVYGGGGSSGGASIYAIGGSGSVYSGGYGIVAYAGLEPNYTRIHAAYFGGNVTVSGSLSKAGGSFKIDHPLDPANKYLSHSFVESPDMMNVYNGNIVTDAHGNAIVQLPDWFEALNRDFRYQLTVIGQFAQAIVGSKIAGNQFTIRTDKPNVEVSWQVTGIRQDPWANANRIPVEEDKTDVTRGHYLHPELYNQPVEKSVDWAERPELMKAMAQRANHK
jgi:hypothetical protein